MGEIEHAGTSKTMPAIDDDMPEGQDKPVVDGSKPMSSNADDKPVIRTSDDGAAVAGEIVAEPTDKTVHPAGADKVAAERGMPPLRRRTQRGTPAFRKR
jgi:hypothetical protein